MSKSALKLLSEAIYDECDDDMNFTKVIKVDGHSYVILMSEDAWKKKRVAHITKSNSELKTYPQSGITVNILDDNDNNFKVHVMPNEYSIKKVTKSQSPKLVFDAFIKLIVDYIKYREPTESKSIVPYEESTKAIVPFGETSKEVVLTSTLKETSDKILKKMNEDGGQVRIYKGAKELIVARNPEEALEQLYEIAIHDRSLINRELSMMMVVKNKDMTPKINVQVIKYTGNKEIKPVEMLQIAYTPDQLASRGFKENDLSKVAIAAVEMTKRPDEGVDIFGKTQKRRGIQRITIDDIDEIKRFIKKNY